jgi:hypothetical protein
MKMEQIVPKRWHIKSRPRRIIKQITVSFIKKISFRKCLLLFGAESFIYQFANQKYVDESTENCNFAGCLYGCKSWSSTLREKQRLRIYQNRVLGKIFGPMRGEVTG